jgi:hypothetical protein
MPVPNDNINPEMKSALEEFISNNDQHLQDLEDIRNQRNDTVDKLQDELESVSNSIAQLKSMLHTK